MYYIRLIMCYMHLDPSPPLPPLPTATSQLFNLFDVPVTSKTFLRIGNYKRLNFQTLTVINDMYFLPSSKSK